MEHEIVDEIVSTLNECRSENINFYTLIVLLILFSNTVAYTIIAFLELKFHITYNICHGIANFFRKCLCCSMSCCFNRHRGDDDHDYEKVDVKNNTESSKCIYN